MSLLVAWVAFPAVVAALSLGCGLAVERATGARLPGALLAPLGMATIVVIAQFATATDATAELATPLAAAVAVAGLALPGSWRGRKLDRWALGAAGAVFFAFAAPVVVSAEATFAGYMKLDDTATWFALTDRVMEHGRDLGGLAPSTYEATLDFNLAGGYPVGAFLPLGVGRGLVGEDVAWVFQPYLTLTAAMLALVLSAIAASLVRDAPRALAAFIAAQAALLFGYSLWGGAKELVGALLVALAAALVVPLLGGDWRARAALPPAIATAAAVSAMSPAGALLWLAPIALSLAIATLRIAARRGLARLWLGYAGLTAALTAPWLWDAGFLPPTSESLTSEGARGNLFEPLSPLQLLGVWPAGDFRLEPAEPVLAYPLIALAGAMALAGLIVARRRAAWDLLLYAAGAGGAAVVALVVGSPWVEAKAMAIASPAILLAAMAGAFALAGRGRRPLALVSALAIAGAVVWSNLLAYREVNLAPRDRLAELERVGRLIAGEGPTLIPEYEPYAARHFLRDADPEAVSELRRRPVPRREGGVVPKGRAADLDELTLEAVLAYRTLVVRRSPSASRPPSAYVRTWRGSHWEVWQRRGPAAPIASHLPVGGELRPAAITPCEAVMRLAREAAPGGRIAAATRRAPLVLPVDRLRRPRGWEEAGEDAGGLVPDATGTAGARIAVPREGRYEVWLGGSIRGHVEIEVGGAEVGDLRGELSYPGHFLRLGEVSLRSAAIRVELHYEEGGMHPGSGGPPFPLGPLVFSPGGRQHTIVSVPVRAADSLCGRRLDWIEALRPAERH